MMDDDNSLQQKIIKKAFEGIQKMSAKFFSRTNFFTSNFLIRLYKIDSMMHLHLVGIYDTTTVRFECQTQRGFVPEHLT